MNNKKVVMLFVSLMAFIMVSGGVSYAYFVYNKDVADVTLDTGDISINYATNNDTYSLTNVLPMNDGLGKTYPKYLDFTVTGKADTEAILYELELIKVSGDIDNQYIKVYLTDQNDTPIMGPFLYSELYNSLNNNGKALHQDIIEGNTDGTTKTTTKNYRLRMWIDESYETLTAQSFSFNVYMYAKNTESLGNLVYDINNVSETTSRSTYSINNGVVTLTALVSNAYETTDIKAYLEQGKTYIFNCDSDATTWDNSTSIDSVEVYIAQEHNGVSAGASAVIRASKAEFTVSKTGIYYLRFDVNKNGETHKFWNISIIPKDNSTPQKTHRITFDDGNGKTLTKIVTDGENYGSLPTATRKGYNFLGWEFENLVSNSDWEVGAITDANGNAGTTGGTTTRLRMKEYLNVYPNSQYKIMTGDTTEGDNQVVVRFAYFYDENQNFISKAGTIGRQEIEVTTPNNCAYLKVVLMYKDTTTDIPVSALDDIDVRVLYLGTLDSSKEVIINKDYTLKAKWEWNNNYYYNDVIQNVTINGGTRTNDYISLNGTSDFLNLGEIRDKKEVSIQATIKVTDANYATGEKVIISNFEYGGFGINMESGSIGFCVYLENNDLVCARSATAMDTTSSHDVTGTYDGSVLKLYIDGVLDTSTDVTSIIQTNSLSGKIQNPGSNTIMAVGGDPFGNTIYANYFKGDIYSVRIYDYAISEGKIIENIQKDGFISLS